MEGLRRDEVITSEQRRERQLTLADYGLQKPRFRIMLGNPLSRQELLVGNESAVGDSLYVKLVSSDDVVATPRGLPAVIPRTVDDLRDRAVIPGEADRTVRLEIHRPGAGFIQLAMSGGRWAVQQPLAARADTPRIGAMLRALFAVRAQRLIWDPPVEGTAKGQTPPEGDPRARAETYGLAADEAAARVSVWVKGDEAGSELILGKPVPDRPGEIYAKRRDSGSIFSVDDSILGLFSVALNDLRDRQVFVVNPSDIVSACFQEGDAKLVFERKDRDAWSIREPVQWRAEGDLVDALIHAASGLRIAAFDEDTPASLDRFGLSRPGRVIQVSTQAAVAEATNAVSPAAASTNAERGVRLLIGDPTPDKSALYAKYENASAVFEISARSVDELGVYPIDPLLFFDRTVLAIPAVTIRRLTLRKDGVDQNAQLQESGFWAAVAPAGGDLRKDAIAGILSSVSALRAIRIEGRNLPNLAGYGLSEPALVLTLGLSGDQSIQKSILLGFRARTDGIYAMVRGQDVVFVLARDVAEKLMKDIVSPAANKKSP